MLQRVKYLGGGKLHEASKIYRNIIIANLFISMKRSGCYNDFPEEYLYLKSYLRRNALKYIFGIQYTLKDKAKVLNAFL